MTREERIKTLEDLNRHVSLTAKQEFAIEDTLAELERYRLLLTKYSIALGEDRTDDQLKRIAANWHCYESWMAEWALEMRTTLTEGGDEP